MSLKESKAVTEDVSFLFCFRSPFAKVQSSSGWVEMWKTRPRFPRGVGREGNRFWFSALSTPRHFHRLFLTALGLWLGKPRLPVEAAEELLFGRLHPCGR